MTFRDKSADTDFDNMDPRNPDPKGDFAYRAKLEAEIDAAIKQIRRLKAENERIKIVMRDLILYAESKTCFHEETHRGGVIWEICDSCGEKWADDEGGKPIPSAPIQLRNAVAILYNGDTAMKDFSTTQKEEGEKALDVDR